MIQKLKEVLNTKGMREAGFPAKVSLPLYLGVFAVVTFDNCRTYNGGELEPELFLVNPDYSSSRRMRKVLRTVDALLMPPDRCVEAGWSHGVGKRERKLGLKMASVTSTHPY